MDQFSHDLTVALEETSLLDKCRVSRWGGQRRRTRSTGNLNLPCAPQPTEDSSSSPTDTAQAHHHATHTTNVDGLNTHICPAPSDSEDDKDEASALRLPCKLLNAGLRAAGSGVAGGGGLVGGGGVCGGGGGGALESDSLNETIFSPARFFKPNARRKRKLKRMSVEFEMSGATAGGGSGAGGGITDCINESSILTSVGSGSHSGGAMMGVIATGTIRKRVLKPDTATTNHHLHHRSANLFFCGKRKRSNRDRYHDHHEHSTSMPRHNYIEDAYRMRPRSFSSTTSKPHIDRLLPLNKGLISKIERISQLQKTDATTAATEAVATCVMPRTNTSVTTVAAVASAGESIDAALAAHSQVDDADADDDDDDDNISAIVNAMTVAVPPLQPQQQEEAAASTYHNHHGHGRKKSSRSRRRTQLQQQLQFAAQQQQQQQPYPMDCGVELNDFLSSSSLSSTSESDDGHGGTANDTDREGDDELTDWPGNEGPGGPADVATIATAKYDPNAKRKLTKKSQLPPLNPLKPSTATAAAAAAVIATAEDMLAAEAEDTLMSAGSGGEWSSSAFGDVHEPLEVRYQPSEPITINTNSRRSGGVGGAGVVGFTLVGTGGINVAHNAAEPNNEDEDDDGMSSIPPLKQIESEMSGETSTNPFLSSSPTCPTAEVREIRAGCRRVKGERPGFSIKTSVNERLARFLQDPRQIQIRLPDIEIYEHEHLINLATLYSLQMSLDNGCAILNKTSNTTQSVNIDQQSLQNRLFLSDFKRRCYDSKETETFMPRK